MIYLLLDYVWQDPTWPGLLIPSVAADLKDKVPVFTALFNAVLQDNSSLSVREEIILSFEKQEEIMKIIRFIEET